MSYFSLKRKLILLILGVSLPFFLLWAFGFQSRIRDATERANARVVAIAESSSSQVHNLVEATENLLHLLSEVPVVRDGDRAARDVFLIRINGTFPAIYNILVADRAGNVRGSGLNPSVPVPKTVGDRSYFSQALASKEPVLGEPILERSSRRIMVPMSFAFRDRVGNPIGIAVAFLDPLRLQEAWADISLPANSVITLINQERLILARSLRPEVFVGTYIPADAPLVRQVLREGRGVSRATYRTDKFTRIAGFAPVDGTPWYVVVGIPVSAFFGPVWKQAILEGVLMLAAMLVALLVAVRLGRRIVGPVGQLVDAADKLAREDYEGARVSIPLRDEIGRLGDRFEEMREKLHQAKLEKEEWQDQLAREVAARTAELSALNDLANTVSQSLNLDQVLALALGKVCEICEVQDGTIFLLEKATQEIVVRVHRGFPGEKIEQIRRFRVGEGVIGRVFQENSPVIVEDIAHDTSYKKLTLFSEARMPFLTSIAQQVAMAIENANLYQELKEAYEEIQRTQDQMLQAERLRVVGEIASGVAHDFNNILVSILAYAELLQSRLQNPAQVEKGLKVIEKAALDGRDAVRRLQEYTGQRQAKDFRLVDVREVVQDAVNQTRPRWSTEARKEGREIKVSCELGEVPRVLGRESDLRQVLANMILNSVQAMSQRGEITLRTACAQGEVLIEVRDNGLGMGPGTLKRIFEPFYTTRGSAGSGLGLSIAMGIVQRHGGSIRVQSQPGGGTTFTISLPPAPESTGALEGETRRDKEKKRGALILAVDDDPTVLETLKEILISGNHQVDAVGGGKEALDLFSRKTYDLVITDLGMPEMNGWELCRRIKDLKPSLPVVLVTGWGDHIDREKASLHGVDFLIAKPFGVSQVLSDIDRVLGQRLEPVVSMDEEKRRQRLT
ncbi:MAG: response regulator [Candidatus Tectomicrobia bacterium]|uniref:histidine kinase n=1 Tax=Tectimicrobiota bacterium TaxID=2528274 RepID=A0A932M117_UNCTE|nr:response regulator [Candidatus Tectomicrobia bacterium]